MPSRTVHAGWVVQLGRMMVAVPHAHVGENSVIQRMFVGTRARRRVELLGAVEDCTA